MKSGLVDQKEFRSCGGRDTFTPMTRAQEMKAGIPGAERFYLEDGSHYVMIEYTKQVHSRIEEFLSKHNL
jgi:pimeloyl-ACP methyl ester carboxylesterase